ncbi:chitinase [Amycolatopsis tucumanensis]|uniref:GH18 domain-containing protein n=1 Tax=Amycolatopsis tucumanensis TaxID=401106 RepID=A0ABP7HUI8_9PSEU|nr:chitinase [Amycolatopsis tucumanensis]MCF6421984.1 chitinase [Amycolatopsis tucumanensis]
MKRLIVLVLAGLLVALGWTPAQAALPSKQLTGYWQNFVNSAQPLKLSQVPDAYDVIVLAFANADPATPGAVTFGVDPDLSNALGGYTDADLKADIAAKKSAGKSIVLSIGGERGNIDLSSADRVSAFVDSFTRVATEFGVQGIDIDLEGTFDAANTASAVTQVHDRMGDGFLVTMAPQTLDVQPGGRYLTLIESVKPLITVVHTQYYNSGSMLGCDGRVVSQGSVDFITAQACHLLQVLRPDQVAIGLPATAQAAGSGYVAPSVVNAALDCLATRTGCGSYVPSTAWPGISGVMTWSVNWDASSGWAFSTPVRAHLDALG